MKGLVKTSMILAVSAVLLAGCNCYNKVAKRANDIRATSTPELLTLRGSTVTADITVTFPANYFHRTAVFRITPVLAYEGGEIVGAPKYLQGERVRDNYTVIPFRAGGSYTQTVTFPYDPKANLSTLELRIEARCKQGAFVKVISIPVARGISTVQNSADWTAHMTIMEDNFRRTTTISENADLMYLINSAQVRSTALTTEQIRLFEEFVRENSNRNRITLGNVQSKGYASPDGPVKFNDELSKKRSETAKDAVSKQLKDVNASFDIAAYGEDWEGFQKLVRESNIPDRDLILQVLQMYSSSVQREEQIRNMSQVFDVLKQDILPRLRRTQLLASADIQGKTDSELKDAIRNNLSSLNLEEMLFAATLIDDQNLQATIYRTAAEKYNDERAYNNYGVILARQGKLNEARSALNKAASIKSAPEISNNLGAVALAEGNLDEARRYLSALNSTDARANRALLALAEGDYANAVRDLNGYNLAVAEFCNGNLSRARMALGNIQTADANYLRAVIAMREGDTKSTLENLAAAFAKDPGMRNRAKNDVEFAKISGTQEFRSL